MKILVLKHSDVERLLPVRECIPVMRETLWRLANGEFYQPLRAVIRPPDASGLMGLMPSYRSGEAGAYGLKVVCVFPDNPQRGLGPHQAA